jgi:predicted ferric reductase
MTSKRPGKTIIYLLLAFTLELFLLSKDSLGGLGFNVFVTMAQIAALIGTVLFATSFMLAARTHLVEEAFGGLDRAYHIHHKAGVWSFSILVAHMATVLIGYGLNGVPLLSSLTANPVFITGGIGLALMAIIALTIIFAKVRYRTFVIIQKFFAIPYAFGIYHLLIVPSDVSRYFPLRMFMLIIVGLGLAAWIWRELLYRWLGPHAPYSVKSVEDKGGGIVEITLVPKRKPLAYRAGQFAYFSFRNGALPPEGHPFSFTSAPDGAELRFAAKALGDYTDLLSQARPGGVVAVYGPYGKFFEQMDSAAGNIFIAGGIGVTPFLSALRGGKRFDDLSVFYTTKSDLDCIYNQELYSLSTGERPFHYHFHESGRRGFLSADIVEKRAGGIIDKTIYLCGPAPMMKSLAEGFIAKGVPKEKIIFESFSY